MSLFSWFQEKPNQVDWFMQMESSSRLTTEDIIVLKEFPLFSEFQQALPGGLLININKITIKEAVSWMRFKMLFGRWPSCREARLNREFFKSGVKL